MSFVMDEMQVHHFKSETKQKSKQLVVVQNKTFWDVKGTPLIDYFEKGEKRISSLPVR